MGGGNFSQINGDRLPNLTSCSGQSVRFGPCALHAWCTTSTGSAGVENRSARMCGRAFGEGLHQGASHVDFGANCGRFGFDAEVTRLAISQTPPANSRAGSNVATYTKPKRRSGCANAMSPLSLGRLADRSVVAPSRYMKPTSNGHVHRDDPYAEIRWSV